MTFANPDSALNLQNSSNNTDRTITLTGILSPGGDQFGKVQLTTENNKLTIDGNGFSLGADHKRLKELDFISTGSGTIDLNVGIFVEKISLGVNAIELGEVNSDVYFTKGTIYSATGNINGKVDFQGNAGIINLADGVNINGTATSTGIQNGTLTFLGAGQVTDLITNIAMLKAGAGDVSLIVGGNYSIDEIQGNGNNNITFAAGTNLTGSINTSGGQAVNLIFTNGGSVSDSIGSSAAVGNITVQAGIVSFGNTVNSGNIVLLNGATIEVKNNLTATDISSDNANSGTLKLNNPAPINIISTIGGNNSLNTIEVANSDAIISGGLNAQNINFSNANNPATLTLNAASNVTNVTTAGNNTHTIAVTDFTANGAIGTDTNKLKSIELLGNGLVNINTDKFSSGVTTANNGQGNVKLNIDGASSYDLGSSGKSLASVQFSGNNTVKGDLYAGNVNIDAGKTVTFDRGTNNTNPKTLNLPNAIVDGTPLPRSLQLFTYLTDVAASNFNFADSTSSAEFKDAVLVNAPINNGGTIKFDQNVWFKEEVKNVQRLEFSPNTSVILEKNIQAGTLIADKEKLILTANSVVEGDLNVTDAILDLANYELKHTGNVTHNGTLTIITYFDTTLKTGGHILVDQGSSYDMSNLNKIIINVVSRSDTTKIAKGDKHQIVTLNEGATFSPYPNSDVTINSSDTVNKWVNWVSDGTGFALVADDVDGGDGGDGGNGSGGFDPSVINPITNPVASGIATQLANNVKDSDTTSSAAQLKKDLEAMPTNTMIETLDRLGHRVNIAEVSDGVGEFTNMELQNILTDVAINMDNLTSEGIFGRLEELGDETGLSGLNEPNSTLKNNNTSGRRRTLNRTQAATAAGDEDNIGTGIWGVPFYGIATQKSKNGASGYKSNTGGGTAKPL